MSNMKISDGSHFWSLHLLIFNLIRSVMCDKALFYQTSPCPNYSLWKKAISVDGAVLKSSNEFHGDCKITFQVPYPDRQRFLLRFESVNIRECHDRLVIYDADDLIDATRLDELSCRSHVDKTRFLYTSNPSGYVTIRYYTYNKGKAPSDFRLVLTAVSKHTDSVYCGFRCDNNFCISTDLRCDSEHINHCGDNSDEQNCNPNTERGGGHTYEQRDFLGMSITVTIIIILSVLFVSGVCVCSIALFVCKRNHIPQNTIETSTTGPPPPASRASHGGDAISSSDATSSVRSHTAYTPVLTDFSNPAPPNARVFHGKSRPSPLLSQHSETITSSGAYPVSYPVPGTPRLTDGNHKQFFTTDANAPFIPTKYPCIDGSKRLLYF